MKQERSLLAARTEFRSFLAFLLETQGKYVAKHGKRRPDVPIMLVGNVLKPYFELSSKKGFNLIDPETPEAEKLRQMIIDALAGVYGKTDGSRVRPLFRSLHHKSTLLDDLEGIGLTELVSVVGHDLGYLGDEELEETLTAQIVRLTPSVDLAVRANLPSPPQGNGAFAAQIDYMQQMFTEWTMAIVYATAYAAAVDDHKGFTLFAQLARIQLRAFMVGIDPYTNGQMVIAYTF